MSSRRIKYPKNPQRTTYFCQLSFLFGLGLKAHYSLSLFWCPAERTRCGVWCGVSQWCRSDPGTCRRYGSRRSPPPPPSSSLGSQRSIPINTITTNTTILRRLLSHVPLTHLCTLCPDRPGTQLQSHQSRCPPSPKYPRSAVAGSCNQSKFSKVSLNNLLL